MVLAQVCHRLLEHHGPNKHSSIVDVTQFRVFLWLVNLASLRQSGGKTLALVFPLPIETLGAHCSNI